MKSTHDTRRCSTSAAVVVALAVMLAPALIPAALAYDAKAGGPADSARVVLPDWDALDGGINPFDGSLIPRRAMESPQEGLWATDLIGAVYAAGCWAQIFGCAGAIGGAWAAYGLARATFAAAEHLHVPPNPCTPGEFCGEAD